MRLDREFWLRFRHLHWAVRWWTGILIFLATAVAATYNWYAQRSSAPLEHYNEVSRRLEGEQHTLDRMRTWRVAWPSPDSQSQDAEQAAEQKQRDLVVRLIKERDALAEQISAPKHGADHD